MPGDRKNPIDGKIIIQFGELQAEGALVGATIAKVKGMMAAQLPKGSPPFPADAVARISTMDPESEAWKKIEVPEQRSLVMLTIAEGLQMFDAATKIVPDDYVIRKEDVHLEFIAP